MKIRILQCENGAAQAQGLTVIIDVFRAFTLEAFLYAAGVKDIIVAASAEEALQIKQEHPEYITLGERGGRKCDGFDYGNSPAAIDGRDLNGITCIHTTSNGTRGILKAVHASEIITGAFVNAKAIASYILNSGCEEVSLVCMGTEDHPTDEDTLCAEYIRSLLTGIPLADLDERIEHLRYTDGAKFFNPQLQESFPQADYPLCIRKDLFSFVIRCEEEDGILHNRRI